MTYYDFVKDYMKVEECKNNKKYSSAGHTFVGIRGINLCRRSILVLSRRRLHYRYT